MEPSSFKSYGKFDYLDVAFAQVYKVQPIGRETAWRVQMTQSAFRPTT